MSQETIESGSLQEVGEEEADGWGGSGTFLGILFVWF